MICSQIPIMSKARNLKGVTSSGSYGQVLKLDKAGSSVTFSGPMSVTVSHVKSVPMRSIKKTGFKNSSVLVSQHTYEIPSQHEWTIDYDDLIGDAGGCLQITATETGERGQTQAGDDLPCDFAVKSIKGTQYIFPPSCEPCESGVVNAPPTCDTPIPIPTAQGGCVRPRFYNGMFITREDLETQLRYIRVKQRLQNRAMGQGVVWGLAVFLEGPKIRVGAGYAVDCCGNDLTVTCDYKVNTEALLSDPALCGKLDDLTCASLVLEYVECLEQPRPVHGEACGQATPACEMSRVRETVRLRLKPRCDDDEHTDKLSEAFDTLLGIIRPQKRGATGGNGTTTTGVSGATASTTWEKDTSADPSWKVTVTGLTVGTTAVSRVLDPRPASTTTPDELVWVPVSVAEIPPPVGVVMAGDSPTRFTSIVVKDTGTVASSTATVPSVSWNYTPSLAETISSPHVYSAVWETDSPAMRSARLTSDEPTLLTAGVVKELEIVKRALVVIVTSGAMTRLTFETGAITFTPDQPPLEEDQYVRVKGLDPSTTVFWAEIVEVQSTAVPNVYKVTVEAREAVPVNLLQSQNGVIQVMRARHAVFNLRPVAVEVQVDAPSEPVEMDCCGDPCCGQGETMDPNDRFMILVLVLFYAKILQAMAELKTKNLKGSGRTPTASEEQMLNTAATNLRRALMPGGAQDTATKREELDEAVREILTLWCCRAIYHGPTCGCGCGCSEDNHGVVIGCAYFEAGEICRVSGLDGRRWVVHPPLVEHWLSTFGFPALDEQVMRLFSKLCCLRGLPGLSRSTGDRVGFTTFSSGTQPEKYVSMSARTSDPFGLTSTPMASAVLRPMRALAGGGSLTHVDDQQECWTSFALSLIRLVLAVETISPGALVDNVNRFLCHPLCNLRDRGGSERENLRYIAASVRIEEAMRGRESESQPVMRGAIARLASSIVAHVPVSAIAQAEAVREELSRRGVETVADLIARDAAEIGAMVKSRDMVRAANKAYLAAEEVPAIVARGVTAAFKTLDKDAEMTPGDWAEDKARTRLKTELKKRLTIGSGAERAPLLDDAALKVVLAEWAGEPTDGS